MSNPFIPIINSYLPEPEASLLVGMLFGRSVKFSKDLYQSLIATGTIHVVALSGMNLTVLINFIGKIVYPLGKKLSILANIIAIIIFVVFVGASPTIVRAGIMASLSLLAIYFGRQKSVFLNLFIAGIIMIFLEPSLLKNLSFQLSFLSTLGILVFAPQPIKTQFTNNLTQDIYLELKRLIKENLRTTLAAQVAVLPLIIFTFSQVSLISPLTNLFISFLITPIMILGFISSLLGFVYHPLGQIIAWFVYPFLHLFVKIVEITSQIPFAVLKLN